MNSKVYLKDCKKFSQLHRGCLLFYNLYIYLTRGLFIPPWHYIFLHCSFLNQVMQHYYYYCLFFFALWQFAAPTVAPTITSAVRTNATTARIMWSAVDTMAAGGIISHYSVRYRPKDYPNENCNNTNASTWTTNTKTADGTSILITELIPTRDYCVAVAATNNAGTGIYSRPVQRKWRLLNIICTTAFYCILIILCWYFYLQFLLQDLSRSLWVVLAPTATPGL